uniref:Uncharacterized protein n=1 Tax=Octopus bimaculoides TaxID=37653 RepID=A0A0L8GJ10_OCTBM
MKWERISFQPIWKESEVYSEEINPDYKETLSDQGNYAFVYP